MQQRPPRRVLVVDDNPGSAEIAALLLREAGHDVKAAEDGERAIELAHEAAPDVIFLDLRMPGTSGYDVARRLQADQSLSPTPRLVAMSGYVDAAVRDRARAAGFDDVVEKPMDIDELMRTFTRYL